MESLQLITVALQQKLFLIREINDYLRKVQTVYRVNFAAGPEISTFFLRFKRSHTVDSLFLCYLSPYTSRLNRLSDAYPSVFKVNPFKLLVELGTDRHKDDLQKYIDKVVRWCTT